ncbi:MAG: NrfD/PsrC family molybdoenzyme membrane anchor subunit, partial [Thermoanaerobaculia bacterium]
LFWYLGLIPDLATLRDRAPFKWQRIFYGILSLGWRGCIKHWTRYQQLYLLLAGLATALVVSVHSIVSLDFAVSIVPGWHSSIFPPYFVAGAIYSGFAMVLTLSIPLRVFYGLEGFITLRHLENMAKVLIATGLIVAYGYATEIFMAWYSGNPFERFVTANRAFGPYWPAYWSLILCNIAIPQLLWIQRIRRTPWVLWMISIVVNIGMWLERYVIVVVSLHRDFLPSSWGTYHGTRWDIATFAGSIGLFLMLLFLFIRFLPVISIAEMRSLVDETEGRE